MSSPVLAGLRFINPPAAPAAPAPVAPAAAPGKGRYAAAIASYEAGRATGAPAYLLTDFVYSVSGSNPKKPGSAGYARFAPFVPGIVVADYLKGRLGSATDLTYNLRLGLLARRPAAV